MISDNQSAVRRTTASKASKSAADTSLLPRYPSTMRKLDLSIALIAALLAPLAPQAQPATTTPVTFRVSDPSGAAIPHAQVRLVPSLEPAAAANPSSRR